MEELRGTEALEREILEDARKRADRIIRKAEDEARSIQKKAEESLRAEIEALEREYEEKRRIAEKEIRSRLPLETMRIDIQYREEALSRAVDEALARMEPSIFGDWCVRRLTRAAGLVKGASVTVFIRGLDKGQVDRLLGLLHEAACVSVRRQEKIAVRGLVIEPDDQRFRISITENELRAWLLDEQRGVLAQALFGAAS